MYWEHCIRQSVVPSPSYEGMLTEAEHTNDAGDAGEDGTEAWMIVAAFAEWLLLTRTLDDASGVAHGAPLFASDPRAAFDGDRELSEAGRRAEALVQGFASADTEARQALLQRIGEGRTEQQARVQQEFLANRIPGWAGWTELGDDWHPFEQWNLDAARDLSERPALKAVRMACLNGGEDTFLISPAAGELTNRFRQAFKNTSVFKFAIGWEPAGPDDDRKLFMMRVARPAEETGIVRFMTSLVRLVNGQDTLLATG